MAQISELEIPLELNNDIQWHTLAPGEALALLQVDSAAQGLSEAEAQKRVERYGPNELVEHGLKSPFKILWEQLTAVMVLILLAAAGLSLFLGKFLEAWAILAIVALFVLLGFFQEYRAERAIAALKKLAVPCSRVYRDGMVKELPARELVPGDVILLEAGNILPADLRVLESANLRAQESILTGESEPVEKSAAALPSPDLTLSERYNMLYMGTQVTYGRGLGLVVQTGMQTELGKIATLIQAVRESMTPLQAQLDRVGKQLALAGVIVALLVIMIGIYGGEVLSQMILTGISLAVAVIPEGLPAVVTVTLALGAQKMLKRNALIRKLPAVETLGSVTTICSDKTGTLTENSLTVTVIEVAGTRLDMSGNSPLSQLEPTRESFKYERSASVTLLLTGIALCNDAWLEPVNGTDQFQAIGDPTEVALLRAAVQSGINLEKLHQNLPRVGELPFDSGRKRMMTVHRWTPPSMEFLQPVFRFWRNWGIDTTQPYLAINKGAVDVLLTLCSSYLDEGGNLHPLQAGQRESIMASNNRLAAGGMRVLGVAFRLCDKPDLTLSDERDLIYVGMIGMVDPPRPEAKQAVISCINAGIRPVMITGDHPLTAGYIASELGFSGGDAVINGADLDDLDDLQLAAILDEHSVFARVIPEHKLRIVEALQKKGEVVAMTGDGVNDAPALKKADIGVAMGLTGTDVAKEAADMVLRDDNFATIVAAVEEGRVIYDNLRRFINFSVAGNIGKVAIMLLWPLPFMLFGLPLTASVALLPLQLLWLNLITDGLLGLSMGMEGAEQDVMRRPPRSPGRGIFSGGMGLHIAWVGLLIGFVGLAVGFVYYRAGQPYWQTMIFTTAAFLQIFQALATRSTYQSLFSIGVFSNRVMWFFILLIAVLQLMALYSPMVIFMGLKPLPPFELMLCVGLGSTVFIAVEIEKIILRRRRKA
ncbi:MAG TPA: cation-translocating P-type ATPase [Chloroflexia bacterium]|nr:cation-translocating P-type ATPase [Chloroflexia bacterium]